MKKIISLLAVLMAVLTFAACSNTNNIDEGILSDPFENAESSAAVSDDLGENPTENPTRDKMLLLNQGGYHCKVNEESFKYDGTPITFPVTMEASEECKTNISIGISCYINGVPQKLSSENDKDKTVIIKSDIEPGESIDFDISFEPIISEEDANKESLPITFITYYNPDYVATEEYISFGNLRDGKALTKSLTLNAKPATASIQSENNDTGLLLTEENKKKYRISDESRVKFILQDEKSTDGVIRRDENGVINFSLVLCNYESGEYIFSLLKNNEVIKFDQEKDLARVSVKNEHIYVIDFEIKDTERGDVIQIIEQNINIEFATDASRPFLIVNGDF